LAQSTEIAMPRLRRPLYQRSEGADDERWCLVLDTDAPRLFVEHEIKRGDMRGSGYGIDIDEIDIADFLDRRDLVEQEQVQRELVRLLGALFEDRREAALA
jgi:hypothetical protein